MENISINTKSKIEVEENSEGLQKNFLNLFEKEFIERRNEKNNFYRKLPQNERKLEPVFDDIDKPLSFIDRIRERKLEVEKDKEGREKIWVIIDFDDVINKTTTYQRLMGERICSNLGLDKKEYEEMYEESKIKNKENKRVLRVKVLIDKLKEKFPDKKELIDNLFNEDIEYNNFIDQGMKRALLALGGSSNDGRDIRITVLTFGDMEYQKSRVEKTDIDEVVDDIIYTEGSKREVLETLLDREYEKKGVPTPFIITIDDSKEQVEDYSGIGLSNNFVNMHYRNPQGKKSMQESLVGQVVNVTENEQNEAALNFYRVCRGCLDPGTHLSREEVFRMLNDRNINDFYQHRNEYNMGREKIISKIDSEGVKRTIHFSADYEIGLSKGNKIIDKDGLNLDDYFSSVEAIYPAVEKNIKYFKISNGDINRSSDMQFEKIEGGVLKTNLKHIESVVIHDNNLVLPFVNVEEFIKNAE